MKNTVALITGSSSGIGLATAKLFLENGAKVIGVSRYQSRRPISHPRFSSYSVDLSSENEITKFLAKLKETREINTVVMCAGYGEFGNLEELSFSKLKPLMRVNFFSYVQITKALLPHLKKKESHLIYLGSESAIEGKRKGTFYCASKFALKGFANALRDECSTSSVKISLIHPGLVRTPFFDNLGFEPASASSSALEATDVAQCILDIVQSSKSLLVDEIRIRPKNSQVVQKHKKLALDNPIC